MMAQVGYACMYESHNSCYGPMTMIWTAAVVLLLFVAASFTCLPRRISVPLALGALAVILEGVNILFL